MTSQAGQELGLTEDSGKIDIHLHCWNKLLLN